MAKVKITAAQIIALRSATMRDNGSYELTTAKGQTVNALTRVGILVSGTRFLTVQGVSVMHAVSDVSVIASKGHVTYVSDSPESLELFTLPERESEGNALVSTDAESVSADTHTGTRDCVICPTLDTRFMSSEEKAKAFACVESAQAKQDAGSLEMINAPESDWMYRANGLTEETSMTIQTVNVVQAHMGMNGVNHYHAPGCRDIEREARRHNAKKGMGVYEFPFSSVAAIIEHKYSDCNNGDAYDMVSHANDDFDGLKIMSCLRDSLPMGEIQGMPVEFKGGKWTLGDAPLDSERCTVCEVFGNVADNSTDIDGKHVCGYCVDNGRTVETMESHSLTFYVETETGTKYECDHCGSIDTRANFAVSGCEGDYRPDNDSDAGFTVESLSIGDAIRFMENGNVETVTDISKMETGMYEIRTQEYSGAHVVSRHMPLFLVSYAADTPDGGWQEYTSTMTDASFVTGDRVRVVNVPSLPNATGSYSHKGKTAHGITLDNGDAVLIKFGHLEMADAGFVETMVTNEYRLSVIVDETTGATVDLGWVTLTMNAAQADDFDRVAEEYGRTHGTGTPRHGWASIITVHDVADI